MNTPVGGISNSFKIKEIVFYFGINPHKILISCFIILKKKSFKFEWNDNIHHYNTHVVCLAINPSHKRNKTSYSYN